MAPPRASGLRGGQGRPQSLSAQPAHAWPDADIHPILGLCWDGPLNRRRETPVTTPLILLTHTPQMRLNYYGDRALAGLRELGAVRLHEADEPLDAAGLVRAGQGAQIIVSDRNTPGYGEIFGRLPDLVAFLRVAVDIRNVDVAAASRVGVLVTQASRTWVPAVSELVIGHMIGIARKIPDMVVA
jgi:D-isomer specific 2-hydroxyacid dehydrogenase-like protein